MSDFSQKKPCNHLRCECSPDCADCVYCAAKFERITIGGQQVWVAVPEMVQ